MNPLRSELRRSSGAILVVTMLGALWIGSLAQGATTLPAPRSGYIPNPGIGFQAMQNLANPVLPETVAYRRPQYSWAPLNPAEGVFDFAAVDADLATAVSLGKQFSFRIYTMRGESFGGHQVPDWVMSEGATLVGGEPRYSNCVYQARWAEFVEALRLHYDGNPDLAFIDISGYGNFNEWSWRNAQTEWDDDFANPTTLDGMARRRLADMFLGGAATVDCLATNGSTQSVSYSYPGFSTTQLLMPYAGIQQSTRYVAQARADVGIRHDCLGSTSHTDGMIEKIGDVIAVTWANAPIAYELCGPEDMADALEVLELTHGTIVHENGGDNDVSELAATLESAGYRFGVEQAVVPDVALFEGTLEIDLQLRNFGLAPAYVGTGQDFDLHFLLLRANGDADAIWTLGSDPNDWMPADPANSSAPLIVVHETLNLPATVTQAVYTAAVGIWDSRKGAYVALANLGTDSEERLLLSQVTFSDGEICGDGLLNTVVGEQCDDGNIDDGDCCSADCLNQAGACDDGNACTTADSCSSGVCEGGPTPNCDDGVACTADSCSPEQGCLNAADHSLCDDALECSADLCDEALGCSHVADDALCDDANLCTQDLCDSGSLTCEFVAEPRLLCDTGTQAALQLSDVNGREKLSWKWGKGTIDVGALGDPTATGSTDYALCIYRGVGELALAANMPGGPVCGTTSSCWREKSGRLSYRRSDALPDGVSAAKVSTGKPGKDKILVKGKYSALSVPEPALPGSMFDMTAPVLVQTINSEGACWGATFNADHVSKNDADSFKAKAR